MAVAQGGLLYLWGGVPAPPAVTTDFHLWMPIGTVIFPRIGAWVDLQTRLMAFEINRGRADALSGIVGGTLRVAVDNDDGAFDPQNAASPYYPNVRIRQRLYIEAVRDAILYPMIDTYLDTDAGEPLVLGANANLEGTDFYAQLQDQPVTGVFPAQLEGARIHALLDAIGFAGGRQISTGVLLCPAANLVEANLLQHIDAICKAGRGIFFIGLHGDVVFRDRQWRLLQPPIGSFGAQGTYPIPTPAPELSRAGVFNRVRVRRSASGANEVQRITITGSPTDGAFNIGYEGAASYGIGHDSDINFIRTALEAMSTIGPGNVLVSSSSSGLPAFPVDVTFIGTLALRPLNSMTITNQSFLGGTAPSVAISTVTNGVDPTQIAEDLASQAKYGVIDYLLDQAAADLLADDDDARLWASWFLSQHAEPHSTIKFLGVDPTIDPALWVRVLEADIGQNLVLKHDLPGSKGIVSDPMYIEGTHCSWKAGDAAGLQVQWSVSLAEAQLGHFFILDSAVSLEVDTWLSY